MSDLISRQAAIDALNEYFVRIGKLKRRGLNKGEKAIRLDTVGAINSLPPAQPEQKVGTWIVDGHHLRCSACGVYMCSEDREGDGIALHFCPNCGAKMEEKDDR